MAHEEFQSPEGEPQETSLEDVFSFLEKIKSQNEHDGMPTDWIDPAIEDLRNDDPNKALDILTGRQGPRALTEWQRLVAHNQEIQPLLDFLKKKFGR